MWFVQASASATLSEPFNTASPAVFGAGLFKRPTTVKLLHVDSSILSDSSVSRQLTQEIVAEWRSNDPDVVVEYLDLAMQEPEMA